MGESGFVRNGVDTLQKVFLYLILLDYILIFWVAHDLPGLNLISSVTVSILLIGYNVVLTQLCFRRARRSSDNYILYPVVFAGILSLLLLMRTFFLDS